MADIYVRSTDGSDADSGADWTNAKATLAGAIAIALAGDTIYLSHVHAEATAALGGTVAGTNASPVRILCVNDSTGVLAATASMSGSSQFGGGIKGGAHVHGVTMAWTAGTMIAEINSVTGFAERYDNCTFWANNSGGGRAFSFGATTAGGQNKTVLNNPVFRMNNAGTQIRARQNLSIYGGSIHASSAAPTGLFGLAEGNRTGNLLVDGFDFSLAATSFNIVAVIIEGGATAVFRNCKLPAGWTGSLVASGQIKVNSRIGMYNCDDGDTNYRLWVEDYCGTIKSETVVTRTGGASDGVTPLSWRMVSSANCAYPVGALESNEIVVWNDAVGAAKTVTVEVLTDGVTLKDDECWLEVQYLGTSGFPLGVFASDAKADVLATAANQTTSTETWTTTGLTTPVKQKLSVTITPQEKGFIHAKVMLAKPSTTVYVCPKASVT